MPRSKTKERAVMLRYRNKDAAPPFYKGKLATSGVGVTIIKEDDNTCTYVYDLPRRGRAKTGTRYIVEAFKQDLVLFTEEVVDTAVEVEPTVSTTTIAAPKKRGRPKNTETETTAPKRRGRPPKKKTTEEDVPKKKKRKKFSAARRVKWQLDEDEE